MSGPPVEIINLETVPLTREKQNILLEEFEIYFKATNTTIRTVLKNHLTSASKTIELLKYPLAEKLIFSDIASGSEETKRSQQILQFAKRFDYGIVTKVVQQNASSPEPIYHEFTNAYLEQFTADVVKTARVEIGRHRKMAKIVRSMRDKTPHFKRGRLILSGILVWVDEKTVRLMTTSGELLPLPFDKRTRNREKDILVKLEEEEKNDKTGNKRLYDRVRITWNDEGYANVDIRVDKFSL